MPMSFADRLTKLRIAGLALVVAAGLGLAACGGGDDDSSSDSGSSSDTNAQFDQALEDLRTEINQTSGLPSGVGDCIIDKLKTDLNDEDIQAVIDANGQIPSDVQSKITNLATDCATSGGGG
jgi:hypothetical protein